MGVMPGHDDIMCICIGLAVMHTHVMHRVVLQFG